MGGTRDSSSVRVTICLITGASGLVGSLVLRSAARTRFVESRHLYDLSATYARLMAQLSTRFVEKVARNEVQRGAWCLLRYEKQLIFRSFLSLSLFPSLFIYMYISLLSLVAARKRERTSRRTLVHSCTRSCSREGEWGRQRSRGKIDDASNMSMSELHGEKEGKRGPRRGWILWNPPRVPYGNISWQTESWINIWVPCEIKQHPFVRVIKSTSRLWRFEDAMQ